MLRRASSTLVAFIAVVGVVAACDDEDSFGYQGTPAPIDTDFTDLVPILTASIDGMDYPFLVDSGSPFTILNSDSFPDKRTGLTWFDLDVWGLTLPGYTGVRFNIFGAQGGLDGILGGDFLRHFALQLDYRESSSRLWDPYTPDGTALSVRFQLVGGGASYVPCDSPGACGTMSIPATRIITQAHFEGLTDPVYVLVDTGASAIVLDEAFYDLLEAASPGRPRLEGISVDTVDGLVPGFLSRVWRATLGDEVSLDDIPVMVIPGSDLLAGLSYEVGGDVVALVGGSFLRMHQTVIDYQEKRLYFTRYLETPHVQADEFIGIGLELQRAGDAWSVSAVYPGTDAAAKLVTPGDVVETVDGTAVGPLTSEGQVWALIGAHPLGEEVVMGIRKPTETTATDTRLVIEDLLPSFPPP